MSRHVSSLSRRLDGAREDSIDPESVKTFRAFLVNHVKARSADGSFVPYSFEGRKPLEIIVDLIDEILGTETDEPIEDASLCLAGGVQFGKTILVMALKAFVTAVLYYRALTYLPDEKLAEGIVDAKFRPEIMDHIPWLAKRLQVGKELLPSGKAVNKKGAFIATDGTRIGQGMFLGLGTIPKSFSADLTIIDERDDAKGARAKATTGRMTSSKLRFALSIGSQRFAGAGQNAEWSAGSQGVFVYGARKIAVEEHWPAVCRLQVGKRPGRLDPKLTHAGTFERTGKDGEKEIFGYERGQTYYLADPVTGERFDRDVCDVVHRRPERLANYKVSLRVHQLAISAIPLSQIVNRWCDKAIVDSEQLELFNFEVLANPLNAAQKITPEVIARAQTVDRFPLAPVMEPDRPAYGGLDTGNRCWFTAREVEHQGRKRLRYAQAIAAADVVVEAVRLFHNLGLSGLLIDAAPLLTEARNITYEIHGLTGFEFPQLDDPEAATIIFPGGLRWLGEEKRWTGLRAAVVEFTKNKRGSGHTHKLGIEETSAGKRYYPVIEANRFETIDRVINELLTEDDGVIDIVDGKPRTEPALLLPAGSDETTEKLTAHFMAGSLREEEKDGTAGDYLHKCENHFLLSAGYGALAELCIAAAAPHAFASERVTRNQVKPGSRSALRRTLSAC